MANTTHKPRPKPARTVELILRPDAGPGAVAIAMGRTEATYLVTPIPSDFGRAFRLEKLVHFGEASTYDVLLDGERSTCECRGFMHHRHCKHVDTLCELVAAGRL